jgi:hypothetical protein
VVMAVMVVMVLFFVVKCLMTLFLMKMVVES